MLSGAIPPFAPDGGLALALLRALCVASLISAFGTLAFCSLVLPRLVCSAAPLLAMARLSLASALLLLGAWLLLQSGQMADAAGLADALGAVPTVLAQTRFGHVISLQAVAALLSLALLGRGNRVFQRRAAAGFALVGLLLQAGHGHALAMEDAPPVLLVASLLHLAGAGFWLGGVPALAMVVATTEPGVGAAACRWFSLPGKVSVALMAGSALVQGWVLVGSVPGLVGTAYGWMALGKLLLFCALFGFALLNRYRLGPALHRTRTPRARAVLLRSLAGQTACGLLVVFAAAVLGGLAPAMHTQALWPFTQRLSLDAVRADPDLAREATRGALLLAGALALLVLAALIRRRARWLAPPAAVLLVWLALPHLDLLFVPAYPTSFYRSPTGFAADSIVAGAGLYPAHCASCHGADGRGDGPAAAGVAVPPADLTAAHLWEHDDGELFWWLSAGMPRPSGDGLAMPGFAETLTEDERWALIDYIRAHNAGEAAHRQGGWTPPLPAPDFAFTCAGGREDMLADLRGGPVRVVIGPASAVPGVTTILAGVPGTTAPSAGVCVTADEAVPAAYALVSGAPVAGMQFLIDGGGWLRLTLPPASGAGALAAALRELARRPAVASAVPMRM